MGLEGIVSKRRGSPYRSGPLPTCSTKNPKAEAVKREAEGLGQTEVAMTDNQRRVVLIVLGIAIFSAALFLSLGVLKLLD
jgi:hypothetical protein